MSAKLVKYLSWLIFWLLSSITLFGQDDFTNPLDVLVLQLEDGMEQGHSRALYELAGIIDEVEDKSKILRILEEHTQFPVEQLSINQRLNREALLDFLNTYGNEIHYSPVLRVFMTQEIEDFKTNFQIIRKRNLSDKERSSLLKRYDEILQATSGSQLEVFVKYQLREIADLQTFESYNYLLECLDGKHLPLDLRKAKFIETKICEALIAYDDPSILEVILEQLGKNQLDLEDARRMLSKFTNVNVDAFTAKRMSQRYQFLLDSIGTLSGIRNYGFEQESTTRLSYFEESVDYYAYMLSEFYDNPWMRENALREMLATHNPRALFYMAAVLYSQSSSSSRDREILENLYDRYINVAIVTKDGEGIDKTFRDSKKDKSFYWRQAIYWAKHYQDYEYDDDRRVFINVSLEKENEELASMLFKKLLSDNETEALEAFKDLSTYPTSIITKLYEEQQSMLRRANPVLPDFRYGYLESIAYLREFCEVEGIKVSMSKKVNETAQRLKENLPLEQRYVWENELAEVLKISDLTALEIEALIHSGNMAFNFSISRVLDVFYSKQIRKIAGNENQLRLYLKKSVLFSSIGVGGVANKYIYKLDVNQRKLISQLRKLNRKEYDSDISDAISYILPEEEDTQSAIPVASFLSAPLDFDDRAIQLVAEPDPKSLKQVFRQINSGKDKEKVGKYISYLNLYTQENYTPYIIANIKNSMVLFGEGESIHTVSDAMVIMLESIFDYSFTKEGEALRDSAKDWLALSKKYKQYKDWKKILFLDRANTIFSQKEITIDEFNELLESEWTDDAIAARCMGSIYKLDRTNDIRKLNPQKKLPTTYLEYFKKLDFSGKYLDDVIDLFDQSNVSVLYIFVNQYMEWIPEEDRGKIYHNLCAEDWFAKEILSNGDTEKIVQSLKSYLDNTDYISEYEEKRILERIFNLDNSQKPILEQLHLAKSYTLDKEQNYNIQQKILRNISPEDLLAILENPDMLVQQKGESLYAFIEKQLGLPAYLFETDKSRMIFKEDLQGLEKTALYVKYLSLAGLEITDKDAALDYSKIYEVLEFDMTIPFSSTAPQSRVLFSNAIISLLNNIYPNQIDQEEEFSYQIRSWQDYLLENNLVDATKAGISFNRFD